MKKKSRKHKTKTIEPGRRAKGSGSLQLRNGWWYFVQTVNGKVFHRSCKTRDRAEAEEAARQYNLCNGKDITAKVRLAAIQEFLKPDEANPTLDEAIRNYCNHPKNLSQPEKAQTTDEGRWRYFVWWLHGHQKDRSRVNRIGAHPHIKRLKEITPQIASEFLKFAIASSSPNTINKYLRVYKRIWQLNNMTVNPWAEFKHIPSTPHQRRSFTKEEVDMLIDKADGELKVLFTIGPYTGLRMSDCATLRWENVDLNTSIISTVPHKTSRSSGKRVQIPIHPKLKEALISCAPRNMGFVLPELASIPQWKLSDMVQEHFANCGLAESIKSDNYRRKTAVVGFHGFRSTFISNLANANAPLSMVQAIVGHMTPELTQLYYRADVERARTFINNM